MKRYGMVRMFVRSGTGKGIYGEDGSIGTRVKIFRGWKAATVMDVSESLERRLKSRIRVVTKKVQVFINVLWV